MSALARREPRAPFPGLFGWLESRFCGLRPFVARHRGRHRRPGRGRHPVAGADQLCCAGYLRDPAGTVLNVPETGQDAAATLSSPACCLAGAMIGPGVRPGIPGGRGLEMVVQAAVTSPAGGTASAAGEPEEHPLVAVCRAAVRAARELGGHEQPGIGGW